MKTPMKSIAGRLLLALSLFPLQPLRAEDAPDEAVFISLTRTEEPVSRMPSNVAVITAREIKESGAVTLADAAWARTYWLALVPIFGVMCIIAA